MACAVIYWGVDFQGFYEEFIKFGAVVDITSLHKEAIGKERLLMKLQFN
jgi:hypothetical protein